MLRYASTEIPSEEYLIRITLDRLARVAMLHKTSPSALCRRIVQDNKIFDRLRSRTRTSVGDRRATITLSLYGRLHKGLDKLDLPIRSNSNGEKKDEANKVKRPPRERPSRRSGANRRQQLARRRDVFQSSA